MSEKNNFAILTEHVSNLVERYKEIKKINGELETKVKGLEIEIELLEDKVAEHDREKLDIKLTIDNIIEKIEELEFGQ